MTDKKQKRNKWYSYETQEEFMSDTNYTKYVAEYDAPDLYEEKYQLQSRYGFMI